MWLKVVALVLVVELSPKSQNRLVMVPLELSLKLTVSGLSPLVGLPLKLAPGATAPVPVSALVLLPSLAVLTTTTLLKVPVLPGAKLTTRSVGSSAQASLVITNQGGALEPTATVPKLRLPGETPSWAGVRPLPVTVLAELPPLLVKTTTLLKLPALVGAKRTMTFVEPKPARLKGVPERILNGPPLIVARPLVKDAPP